MQREISNLKQENAKLKEMLGKTGDENMRDVEAN